MSLGMHRIVQDKLETSSENIHDLDIYDPTSIDWSTFEFTNGYYSHYLTKDQILKPYIISYIYYQDVGWEYVLLLINNILDIEDVPPGTEIYIPKIGDLQDFILKKNKGDFNA